MLLKISDGTGGWVYFDGVDRIHLITTRKLIRSKEELAQPESNNQVVNLIRKESFVNGTPVEVGVVEFFRGDVKMTALFTSVAFICNNGGDTIERINVKR